MKRHVIRHLAVTTIMSLSLLPISVVSPAEALPGVEGESPPILEDFCESLIFNSTDSPPIEKISDINGESFDDNEADLIRTCSDQSDKATLILDNPETTEVRDPTALTIQEQGAVAAAVRAANEHLLPSDDAHDMSPPDSEDAYPAVDESTESTISPTTAAAPTNTDEQPLNETDSTSITQSPTETSGKETSTPRISLVSNETPLEEAPATSTVQTVEPEEPNSQESSAATTELAPEESSEVESSPLTDPVEDTTTSTPSLLRNLTEEELTYHEGETIPLTVKDRLPGIYVDSVGKAGVVFNDGSFTLFPEDATVVAKSRLARSARALAPAAAEPEAANSSTVAAPSPETKTIFNELYLSAMSMPSEILVDSTASGTGRIDEVQAVPSRTNESQPKNNASSTLPLTADNSGTAKVLGTASQSTVWYSSVSDYNNGRYQPTESDPRLPAAVAPRMTITNINMTSMTAKVNYQFYLDYSAFFLKNGGSQSPQSGLYASPYDRFRSDPVTTGDNISTYFIPLGAGSTSGNCRRQMLKTRINSTEATPKVNTCFLSDNQSYDKLSATVPITRVENTTNTYRISTGFNSDWLLATFDSTRDDFRYIKPSMFDQTGTYKPTSTATYHLLETWRVQIPDLVVALPFIPTLPLTGGVSETVFLLSSAALLILAAILAAVEAHRRKRDSA